MERFRISQISVFDQAYDRAHSAEEMEEVIDPTIRFQSETVTVAQRTTLSVSVHKDPIVTYTHMAPAEVVLGTSSSKIIKLSYGHNFLLSEALIFRDGALKS